MPAFSPPGCVQAADAGPAGRRLAGCRRRSPRCGWRCRPASSISGARRRPRNICTAQVLLAVMAGFYAVWHGPEGLRRIARRVNLQARLLADAARRGRAARCGMSRSSTPIVDRGRRRADALMARAVERRLQPAAGRCRLASRIALDETVTRDDLRALAGLLGGGRWTALAPRHPARGAACAHRRSSPARCSTQPSRRTRDAALPEAAGGQGRRAEPQHDPARLLHDEAERHGGDDPDHAARASPTSIPFAPADQTQGYLTLIDAAGVAGCARSPASPPSRCSPMPAAQGEYAGLLAIRACHEARGETHRDVCLIPSSARTAPTRPARRWPG